MLYPAAVLAGVSHFNIAGHMTGPTHKIATRLTTAAIVILSSCFYIYSIYRNFDEIPSLELNSLTSLVVLFSVVLVVFNIFIGGLIWHLLLRANGVLLSFFKTQSIYSVSQFGKYLPGNIGQHLGRVVMARDAGIPYPAILSTMLIEMLWGTGIGVGLALTALFTLGIDLTAGFQISPALLALAAVLVFTLPWLGIWGMNRYFPRIVARLTGGAAIPAPRLQTAMIIAILILLAFLVLGIILKLQAVYLFGVNRSTPLELACLFSLAWLAGYFTPGAPGGLGTREAIMVLVFSPVLGAGVAVGLGISLRVTTTIGDGMAFLLGLLFRRCSSQKAETNAGHGN